MGFEGLSQPRHSGVAVRGNQRQKATALSSRQGLSAIGIAARSWADCQSFPHLSLASDQKGPSYSDSAVGGPASRHGQTHQLGSMKISSQLANNFGYWSTAVVRLVVICRGVKLLQRQFGYHGHRYQLRMNMFESSPGLGALVLTNKDVSKSSVASKLRNASTISPKDCFKLTFAQQGHIGYMIRAFNNDFVHADATTDLVAPISNVKSTAIWHESGIFVRDHADGPAR